ncbi:N-glycosyltransferase [Saccharopolyspora erythraea NRRL 2338]|uniref:Glycosyltransferase n=2 Tax=Saccharopolyspora erythraea TaxID=1836 RepID=A4FIN8_SACEN|nr:glycosyltransferase [Saccharopolyspora erythraea]EQD85880.1 glycosyl transferase [Saccharopolyspora erythraea D]PFG97588.1 N-glycosyltransferase [Saccharopolyspora erythraea NRRL 2338]QRK87751.1 glycosyltransferase family 1 protein [Saccharopolyspora erythraea]CAM03913.1 putative glycosyltransferase [Saccharopolyspora erythraea NRRL 2338]
MRIVLTCLPYYSHLVPVVIPVARALRRAGHTAAVATAPAMAAELARHGIEHLPLPNVRTLEQLLADPAFLTSPGMPGAEGEDTEETARAREDPGPLTKAFAGPLAGTFARDLIAAAADWRPDVIVRECNEFGGYLAAERLGLPRAVLDIAPYSCAHLPFLRNTLNSQLDDLGLDPSDDPWQPNAGLLAAVVPAAWYPERLRVPSLRSYRPNPAAPRAFPVDAERPLVLAGLGTVAHTVVPEAPRLLAAMVAALGELPCDGVVSLGPALETWSGPRPANVRLMSFAPQRELLGRAALFLSHGGFGGVHEAVQAGTPMVNLPLFADQPDNARRVTELGLGLHLDPAAATPEALAEAAGRVLTDRGFRRRAAELARQSREAPGFDVLAEDLAALA